MHMDRVGEAAAVQAEVPLGGAWGRSWSFRQLLLRVRLSGQHWTLIHLTNNEVGTMLATVLSAGQGRVQGRCSPSLLDKKWWV